jgi:beta-galactosidase
MHIGSGYGIHREVYLETTGKACITDIFARGDIENDQSSITTHFHSTEATDLTLDIKLMPENFDGKSFEISVPCKAVSGENNVPTAVQMSNAKRWTPDTPYLYRCRVTLKNGRKIVDSHDVLFGYRSFSMVSEKNPKKGSPPGMFLLNGKPIYLRGTNIQGMNALWYWGENDKMLDIMLMLKAAHFNAVRSCQHVQYPEVRELQDRLGIMSEQDQGSRLPKLGEQTKPDLIVAAGALARVCYNNPGVVLLSYANETMFDPTEMVETTLEIDPERILKPISGRRPKIY